MCLGTSIAALQQRVPGPRPASIVHNLHRGFMRIEGMIIKHLNGAWYLCNASYTPEFYFELLPRPDFH